MMDTMPMESDYQKRQKMMAKRLDSMPKDNPVIKRAVTKLKRENGADDVWKKFEIVDTLVSAARTEYTNGSSFNDVIQNLSDALEQVLDKGKKSADTDE